MPESPVPDDRPNWESTRRSGRRSSTPERHTYDRNILGPPRPPHATLSRRGSAVNSLRTASLDESLSMHRAGRLRREQLLDRREDAALRVEELRKL